MTIKDSIEYYEKNLLEAREHIQKLHTETIIIPSDEIRNGYNVLFKKFETKQTEIETQVKTIEKNIERLEECKKLLKEINQEMNEFIVDINNKKIGTLEDITWQFIKENPFIEMDKMDEIVKTIINQDY